MLMYVGTIPLAHSRISSCCLQAPIGGEYSATLSTVVNTSSIPYRFLQLDSWRYFKVGPPKSQTKP